MIEAVPPVIIEIKEHNGHQDLRQALQAQSMGKPPPLSVHRVQQRQKRSKDQLTGRLIIIPAINLPAVEAGLRVSPIDGLNLNRTFPGDSQGSITQQLSAYVTDILFPLADAFIDLHSGGSSLSIVPSAIVEPSQDAELSQKIRAAVFAFSAPMNGTPAVTTNGSPG